MKKTISICSIIGATVMAIVCADIGLYLVSIMFEISNNVVKRYYKVVES